MVFKGKDKFGDFGRQENFKLKTIVPITTEFSKGSVPDSIISVNRESAWSRWRRGYELATASFGDNSYDYPFKYVVPLPAGGSQPTGNPPTLPGIFKGFPTKNKEFGMHWAGARLAGSLRTDVLTDSFGTPLSIAAVTQDASYWYVTLAGSWSPSTPLPPPFYVAIPGVPGGLKALLGEIFEDRIISRFGVPITKETIDPTTQKRYGYTQAVLVDVNQNTGVLILKKAGSVEATSDRVLITPANTPFHVGRYFINGTRYCCSCQDFNHRDYAFTSSINGSNNETSTKLLFPKSSVASIKPGRYEVIYRNGTRDSNAMTNAQTNRHMDVIAPTSSYTVPPQTNIPSSVDPNATRDNPGIYRDFGATYLRNTPNISVPGARADGMPLYEDYAAQGNVIISITDNWTPLLDEMRYCKHIYAMKFEENVFPPEPSDFPVGDELMSDWEQKLVAENENDQMEARAFAESRKALAFMDLPPMNCQAPMMMPMMQRLFNVPGNYIVMQGFLMQDKDGNFYSPYLNQKPSIQ